VGNVFKPFVTRPLPDDAKDVEIVTRSEKRFAIWTDRNGKKRQAEVTPSGPARLRKRSSVYFAQFRDPGGVVRRVPTGCKSRDSAMAVLADLQKRAEKVRSGVLTAAEATVADHADTPVSEHIDAYISHLAVKRGRGARRTISKGHVENVRRDLHVAVAECGFKRLRDLNREAVAAWIARLRALPDPPKVDADGKVIVPRRPAPRTINAKLGSLTAWGNWLVDSKRLVGNPFTRLGKTVGVEAGDDVRRKRRALTEAELRRLLTVARLRPVAEYGRATIKREAKPALNKSRATWKRAELTFETIVAAAKRGRERVRPAVLARLEQSGWERSLLYAVLVTTGLRKSELAALTLDHVLLDDERPAIMLQAEEAKNGKEARLPLHPNVAAELRTWVTRKKELGNSGSTRLFYVPGKLVKILYRDLKAAGIPQRDKRGRIADVHALRGTFGTHLARAQVDPLTLKTLTRHGRVETALKHYVDDALIETDEAVGKLPAFFAESACPGPDTTTEADGTHPVALDVALRPVRNTSPVSLSGNCDGGIDRSIVDKNAIPIADSARNAEETEGWLTGLEPATPRITI
jgi:integrase